MEAMTYASLIEDIKTYAERKDSPFVEQVPRFIMMAENRIASEVRGLGLIRVVSGIFTTTESIIPKPTRWRETLSFHVVTDNSFSVLKQRGYTYLRAVWPDATQLGVPEFYADYDYEHFLVAPTPEVGSTFEIQYHERPIPLSEANQTNWTTQYAPQLLLYASLLEAQPFLKLPERTAEFQALFDRASAALLAETQRRLNGDQSNSRTVG